ncbi:CNH domain-containing protein [Mycena sanguinolenta]|nr:CNH domain-containing protein [Mycena sanguinolenta]
MALQVFVGLALSEGFFQANKVNCAAVYNAGRIVYGTGDGVYLQEMMKDPVKVLALNEVSQVDVLEDNQFLIVLSERQVLAVPLDTLDSANPNAGLKHAIYISTDTSFFKAGFCFNRVLVTTVNSKLNTVVKVWVPVGPTTKHLLRGNTALRPFREFSIPTQLTSIHYLKTRICVGCSYGFEIVDLETLETHKLLNPSDNALNFLVKRPALSFLHSFRAAPPFPMAIHRVHNEYLLCYDKFAFYITQSGKRWRDDFMITWEGQPTGFALHWPYVLAFSPSFVEIRNIESGLFLQKIPGSNIRLLFANMPPSIDSSSGRDTGQRLEQLRQGSDQILMASEDRILAVGLSDNHQELIESL